MTSVSCDDDFGVPDAEYWRFLDESGNLPDYDPDSSGFRVPQRGVRRRPRDGVHEKRFAPGPRAPESRADSMPPMNSNDTTNSASSSSIRRHGCGASRHIDCQAARLPICQGQGEPVAVQMDADTDTGALVRQLWDGKRQGSSCIWLSRDQTPASVREP